MHNIFRQVILTGFISGTSFFSSAQDFSYSVNVQNSVFEFLTNPSAGMNANETINNNNAQANALTESDTAVINNNEIKSISNNMVWDDENFQIPIGFSYRFAGQLFNYVKVRANGTLSFDNEDKYNFVALLKDFTSESDANNNSLSPITSELLTLPDGTKRLKIEFRNAAFITSSGEKAHINFQIWLNQANNSIELHVGALDRPVSNETCIIGFLNMSAANNASQGHVLQGNPASPVGLTIPHGGNPFTITNMPSDGARYIFTPTVN